jgi:hypothetical protein
MNMFKQFCKGSLLLKKLVPVSFCVLFLQNICTAQESHYLSNTLTYNTTHSDGVCTIETWISYAYLGLQESTPIYRDNSFETEGVLFKLYRNGILHQSQTVHVSEGGNFTGTFLVDSTDTGYYQVKAAFLHKFNCQSIDSEIRCDTIIHDDTTETFSARKKVFFYSEHIASDFNFDCDNLQFTIHTNVFANSLPHDATNETICAGLQNTGCLITGNVEWSLVKNGALFTTSTGTNFFTGGRRWENTFIVSAAQGLTGSWQVRLRFNYATAGFLGFNSKNHFHDHFTDVYVINDHQSFCCFNRKYLSWNVQQSNTDNQEASDTIIAVNTIYNGGNARYHAGTIVKLIPGFVAQNGSYFHAYMEGCSGVFSKTGDPIDNKGNKRNKILYDQLTMNADASEKSLSTQPQIDIFPNPASNTLYLDFKFPDESNVTISFSDIAGKQLINERHTLQGERSREELNLQGLSDGIYILRIVNDNGSLIRTEKVFLSR